MTPPPIGGAYVLGLRTANFIFLVCVHSSSECSSEHKLPQNHDLIFENFSVLNDPFFYVILINETVVSKYLSIAYISANIGATNKLPSTDPLLWPQKGFGASLGCH